MFDIRIIVLLARRELRDALRNRWFVIYSAGFICLAMGLSWVALAFTSSYGVAGFGRTSAGMINLVLLVVPLMGLTLGALAIAGERERGEMLVLLAQPVTQAEMLLGKYVGLALALIGSLALGFGLSGLLVVTRAGAARFEDFVVLVGMTILLALGSLSMGFAISAGIRRSATAMGGAVIFWLGLVFLSDLALMATAVSGSLGPDGLFATAMANPLQVFKMAVILGMRDNLEVLGPAGTYAVRTYGSSLLPGLLTALGLWVVVPLAVSYPLMKRKGAV
ncbi:MAG: ABC transporter permease subunit [Dehalococcoidia bacterium]